MGQTEEERGYDDGLHGRPMQSTDDEYMRGWSAGKWEARRFG